MNREQQLIDICFELVLTCTDKMHAKHFSKMSIEDRAAWVVNQLEGCGFPTKPCGSLWGVLQKGGK